jgi:hypothetical protein
MGSYHVPRTPAHWSLEASVSKTLELENPWHHNHGEGPHIVPLRPQPPQDWWLWLSPRPFISCAHAKGSMITSRTTLRVTCVDQGGGGQVELVRQGGRAAAVARCSPIPRVACEPGQCAHSSHPKIMQHRVFRTSGRRICDGTPSTVNLPLWATWFEAKHVRPSWRGSTTET